jgi:hypothetical protein
MTDADRHADRCYGTSNRRVCERREQCWRYVERHNRPASVHVAAALCLTALESFQAPTYAAFVPVAPPPRAPVDVLDI